MAHAQATAQALAKPKSATHRAQDAIALLMEDHQKVKKMFKELRREGYGAGREY